ncbi:YdaS family helix-turn-helix protein [Pseudescherichia sp.]|uniref:transcriptional regulator n=1 Tax=Pseudescherichia sp. TaxID=2055881 RepID=UPI0028A1FD4A|nr:YdaS family helix-turn-helix protein [Pseudescherichia sp.]
MKKSLKEKITNTMSRVDIGAQLGISSQAVSKWMSQGKVPAGRVVPLCKVLNWAVTPHEIDPGAYPNPTDGLPRQEH